MGEKATSSYKVHPGTFRCDYCQCYERNGISMYCQESGKTYHKECFLAEARRKTKDNSISLLVEQEDEEYFYEKEEKERILKEELLKIKIETTTFKDEVDFSAVTETTVPLLEETPAKIPANPEKDETKPLKEETAKEDSIESIECYPFEETEEELEESIIIHDLCKTQNEPRTVSTSEFSNYIEVGIKIPGYRKYHVHSYVDNGSGLSLAKKFSIPEELWMTIPGESVAGRTIEGRRITMNTVAKKIKFTMGGATFTIDKLWQSESQNSDMLLGNDFLLQQTFI